jgi:tubulin-folding cofactor B
MRITTNSRVSLLVNMRKFKQKLKDNNPEYYQKKEVRFKVAKDEEIETDLIKSIRIGDRCEVKSSAFRGEVRYIGKVPNLNDAGYFVGILLDEPLGKNNGTYNGVPYFKCPNKHGIFARLFEITIGDFPEMETDEI